MCGRMAQTVDAVNAGAKEFCTETAGHSFSTMILSEMPSSRSDEMDDNFNLSPGMDCAVMFANEHGEIDVTCKKWGIIRRGGTERRPLHEKDVMKLCFESLCYNARCDTLYSKPTFSRLARNGRTCIIALDGYFEWKTELPQKINKRKQPYFLYRKREKKPLYIAGLWTSVATGVSNAPELHTFTILTTEANKQINWLHHRMPVCIWESNLAKSWLRRPSEPLVSALVLATHEKTDAFAWHKVTPSMSKLNFRSREAIQEVKDKTASVKKYFLPSSSKSLKNKSPSAQRKSTQNSSPRKGATSSAMLNGRDISHSFCHSRIDLTQSKKRKSVPSIQSSSASNKQLDLRRPRQTTRVAAPQMKKKQLTINAFFEKKTKE